MRQLLCVALLLFFIAYGGITGVSGDRPKVPGDLVFTYVPYQGSINGHHHGHHWKPLRIAVNMGNVLEGIRACGNEEGNGNGRFNHEDHPKIEGGICKIIGALSNDKAMQYYEEIVYDAVKLHADRLLVKHKEGNLKVVDYGSDFPRDGPCWRLSVNPDDSTAGIPKADVVIYMDLTTSEPHTEICKTDDRGRPIAANIRLRPQDLLRRGGGEVNFLAHHIAHAIGFDTILEKKERSALEGEDDSSVMLAIREKHLKEKLNEVFECEGGFTVIPLERDSDRKKQLHFPSRFVENELMSPYDMSGIGYNETVYSALTLAVFEATEHFKADFGRAQITESWKMTQKRKICKAQK